MQVFLLIDQKIFLLIGQKIPTASF